MQETSDHHYTAGQHAAIRGVRRVLCNAPSPDHYAAWYAGFDSISREHRGSGPLTGPIPQSIIDLAIGDSACK